MAEAIPCRKSRRGVLYIVAALVLLSLATIGFIFGPLLFAPNHYAGVPSIERRSDYRPEQLMLSAWSLSVARRYRRNDYEFQDNPSFCGPASISNLLRSTGVETTQHQVIDGTQHEPWFGILIGGMTLDALADLLSTRADAEVHIERDPTLPQFRALMTTANDPRRRMIVNFHRGPLFGRGHGHFSPVLGYLAERDLVLVGDVNADYKPYLVPVERLWRGVDTVDDATGKKRGLLIADLRG